MSIPVPPVSNSRQCQRAPRRTLDWDQIRAELTEMGNSLTPVSVAEAARRLDVDVRQLYQNANTEARILAERWRRQLRRRGEQSLDNAREAIDVACQNIVSQGKAINLREVRERVPQEVLGSVSGVISLLQDAKGRMNRPDFPRHPRAVGNGVVRTLPAIVRWRSNGAVLGCRTSRCS